MTNPSDQRNTTQAPRTYCAAVSRAAQEPLYATATPVPFWLMIEYRERWESSALAASRLPANVKQHLFALTQAIPGLRIVLLRRYQMQAPLKTGFFSVCDERAPRLFRFEFANNEDLLALDIRALIAGLPVPGVTPCSQPLYLTCTHGTHDLCCAKLGVPIAQELQRLRDAQAWQVSHVGGDRFAPNLLCFPHGLYYGRVEIAEVAQLVTAYEAQRLYLPRYRGRVCYARPAQAAEFFIRQQTGETRLPQLYWQHTEALGRGLWRVQYLAPDTHTLHRATVELVTHAPPELLTCHATSQSARTTFALQEYTHEALPAPALR